VKKYRVKLLKATKANQAHEILVHGPIGKSFWSDEGISGKEFTDALNEIPAGEKVTIGVNSQGGAVGEGLAIYNAIKRRAADITVRIDGYALSIASFFPLAASKVVSPKSSIWMIHNAWSWAEGNAAEMRDAADMLETHDRVILAAYTAKTGKSESEIKKAMADETWLSGAEAIAWKLADEEGQNTPDLEALDFTNAPKNFRESKRIPQAAFKISAPQQGADKTAVTQSIMNRDKILALLKKHGIKVPDNATDEQLLALVETIPTAPPAGQPAAAGGTPAANSSAGAGAASAGDNQDVRARLTTIEAAYAREREARIGAEIDECITEHRIPVAQRAGWLKRAMADETVLSDLRAMPQNLPGGDAIGGDVQVVAEDPKSIEKAVLNLWGKGVQAAESAMARARQRAAIISANLSRIMPVLNTNTVSTDLKRTVILQQSIRAFAIKVLPLSAFSTVFQAPRLEGTDKVAIPYFALDTTASTDFVAANGYDTLGNTNSDAKVLTVDKRKYQGLSFTSSELARQPFMDIGMGMMLKVEQLGVDVVNDVLSLVTLATYGAAVKTELASAFDSEDVIDLKGVADLANWPASGRSLMLNSGYDVNLLKDASIKGALNFGDSAPIREGRIQRIVGFDYFPDSRIPANGENLQGFIAFKSALLVGFSPITPTNEVRQQLTRYEVVVEPTTGVTLEYRAWGDPDKDTTKETVETNYGRVAGEAAALKRITSA
jgi:ATP-dependent protease ClpP protease subunit